MDLELWILRIMASTAVTVKLTADLQKTFDGLAAGLQVAWSKLPQAVLERKLKEKMTTAGLAADGRAIADAMMDTTRPEHHTKATTRAITAAHKDIKWAFFNALKVHRFAVQKLGKKASAEAVATQQNQMLNQLLSVRQDIQDRADAEFAVAVRIMQDMTTKHTGVVVGLPTKVNQIVGAAPPPTSDKMDAYCTIMDACSE